MLLDNFFGIVEGMSVLQRNNIRITGRSGGQPMLFLHGFGCDQSMWRFMVPAFERDYRIVLVDQIGFGGSDLSAYDPARYGSLDGYAADVLEICRELNLSDVIFVGHSVSSITGVVAAVKDPKPFARLVLVAPSPRYLIDDGYPGPFSRADIDGLLESLDSNYLGWSAQMAPAIMGNPDRPELGQELTNSFCRTDPSVARQFAKVTFLSDNRADLEKVQLPCLVLQCSDDVLAPLEVGEYIARRIPRARLVVLQATGHCPNLSAPQETAAAIADWLKTPVAAGA